MNKTILYLVFGVICIADLVVMTSYAEFRYFSKPLIMISLMAFFLTRSEVPLEDSLTRMFLVSMVFGLGGDVLLMFDGMFLFGLLSFLVMQIGYISCYLRGKNFFGRREITIGMVIAMLVVANILYLWPNLDTMKFPVIFYSLALGLMAWTAFTRDLRKPGYFQVAAGSVFFLISDSLLGIEAFTGEILLGRGSVMVTYCLAQLLIVTGFASYLASNRQA